MSRNERVLFILTILPVLVTGVFLMWFVIEYRAVSSFVIALLALCAITITMAMLHRRIRQNFIDPVIRLNQQLEEPDFMYDPSWFEDGTPIQNLVLTLQQKRDDVSGSFQEQLTAANKTIGQLQESLEQLKADHHISQNALKDLETKRSAELTHLKALIQLSREPLTSFIGYINLLPQNSTFNAQQSSILTKIEKVAKELVFLTREFQEFNYALDNITHFDVHQLVDDAIASIYPLLIEKDSTLLPIFDESCRLKFEGKPELIKAFLFNFILIHLGDENRESQHQLVLQVSFVDRTHLIFSLSPLEQRSTNQHHERLNELGRHLNTKTGDTHVSIPVSGTLIPSMNNTSGMTAYVASADYIQQRSVQSRLLNLGIEISDDSNADICVVCFDQHDDIAGITAGLEKWTRVLLLKNATLYTNPNWHQLRDPLDHGELVQTILTDKDIPSGKYHFLVVDDNESNLRLIALLLEELGHTVITTNNPIEAISIASRIPIDLIFMDIQMPRMSGMKASRFIREQGFDGVIIALTAHLSEEERLETSQSKMNDALLKPIHKKNLNQIIQKYLGHQKAGAPVGVVSAEGIFDEQLALHRSNNRQDLALELMQILIDSLPEDQENLNSAYVNNNVKDFCESAHRINGALRYCGVPRLENAINELESLAKTMSPGPKTETALNLVNLEIQALQSWYESATSLFQQDPKTQSGQLPGEQGIDA